MENITDITVGPMPESRFLKPLRLQFKQDGKERYWDFVKLHESVAILLFNRSRKVFVFVKQFRPAVFFSSGQRATGNDYTTVDVKSILPSNGITLELCAGIMDDDSKTHAETAKQEVLEECGYDVPLANFEKIISHRSGVGVSGDKTTAFFAEITDEMKVSSGGGLAQEGEFIDVVEMTIPEAKNLLTKDVVNSPGGFLFSIMWFLVNKAPLYEK